MRKVFLILLISLTLLSCWKNNISEKEETFIEVESQNILALGDSITAWYNLDYEESYPVQLENILEKKWYNYKIINAWVSWDTSKNLLSRINLYTEKYDVVLLNIWWNDWLRSLSLVDLKRNILEIIDNFPESKIVLFSIDLPSNYSKDYREKLKQVYREVSEEKKVYFYWLFFEWVDYNKHFLNDQIHPNKEWYEIISENISEYLLKNNIIKND